MSGYKRLFLLILLLLSSLTEGWAQEGDKLGS